MPELPDIAAYITALEARVLDQTLQKVRLASPFLLRTVQPKLETVEGHAVRELRRIGKRIAFGLSIATASLAGACLIIIQPVEPSIGREYIGRIFAICVLGGLGSFPGMVIAAMTLGIAESLTATFFGPSWAPAVAFGILLVTLAVRPSGILGR